MWELDHKEGWVPKKNWCFQIVVLEKILEGPLDNEEIKPVIPKGNQPSIFIGRTDAEALIVWPPDVMSQLIGKDPDAVKDWRQEEKGMTEDEMVGCITYSVDMSMSKLQEIVKDREAWGAAVHGAAKSWTWISNWSTTTTTTAQNTKYDLEKIEVEKKVEEISLGTFSGKTSSQMASFSCGPPPSHPPLMMKPHPSVLQNMTSFPLIAEPTYYPEVWPPPPLTRGIYRD